MYISLQELQLHKIPFNLDVATGDIDYGGVLGQSSLLHAEGTAELANHSLNEVRVRGNLSVKVAASCDRCLEPARFPIDRQFDLSYWPAGEEPTDGEIALDERGSEIGFYEGNGLELNDVLREVVLLALPMQLTCREDCKGICPSCGQNRNLQSCDCHAAAEDDRWSKLKQFRVEIGPAN